MLGGIATLAALISFVVAHEAGHFFAAKATGMKVTEFFIGFGPRIWSFKRGDTEYGIKPILFGAYVKVVGMSSLEEVDPDDAGRTYRDKPFWAKSFVVLSGVAANFLLAYFIFFGLALWQGELVIVDGSPVPIATVESVVSEVEGVETAAFAAGMQRGDQIVAIDQRRVDSWDQLVDELAGLANTTIQIGVIRDGKPLDLTVVMGAREDPVTGRVRGFLGIEPAYDTIPIGLFQAGGVAGRQVAMAVPFTLQSFSKIFRFDTIGTLIGGLAGGEIPDESRPVSPVGIVQIGAQAADFGIANLVAMMALINIFLGTFNVIPLFPLDGGHFAVAVYEKLTGRQANMNRLVPVAVAVVVLVASIGLLTLALDILKPIKL